ncbi:MAG: MarR family transcriptional regulator [Anaerolineae bacterium]|nr:MarR family transcriptional regulator [Anaerolineae bacterium]
MKPSSSDTYRLINEVFIVGDDIDRQLFNRFSLTVRQYHLLNWLHHKGQASLTELANLLLCDKSNVTGIVRRLKAAKLIEEMPKSDRRFTTVRLTEAGDKVHQEATQLLEESIAKRFAKVGAEEHAQIQHLLTDLHQHLRAYLANGHLKGITGKKED